MLQAGSDISALISKQGQGKRAPRKLPGTSPSTSGTRGPHEPNEFPVLSSAHTHNTYIVGVHVRMDRHVALMLAAQQQATPKAPGAATRGVPQALVAGLCQQQGCAAHRQAGDAARLHRHRLP